MTTATAPDLTVAEATYIQLSDLGRGQFVTIGGTAGRQRGIVTAPLREFSSHIDRAFLIVHIYGVRTRIRIRDVLSGKYWVAPELPARRRTPAKTIAQLAGA
jgi:hypothetical protein